MAGLFARDKMYGGNRFDETFPLSRIDGRNVGNSRVTEESADFIVWECLGVTATDVPTSIGKADKVAFIVSDVDNPTERIEVGTFASSIVDMVTGALDGAREEMGEEGKDADFATLSAIAFGDLPAIGRLQRIPSRINRGQDALILTLVSDFYAYGKYPQIDAALRNADKKKTPVGAADGSDHPLG